jgi:hypothetical protein
MRAAISWLLAALAVCLLITRASAEPAPAVGAPDAAVLRGIESQVASIRGLPPLSAPDLKLLDHTSLHAYLSDEFTRNYLPNERESDQDLLTLLGLIQPTDDLAQIQLNLLNDQVIGVYDADAKSLFVVSDQAGFGPAARITYAHEFNHALQDQYYDLSKIAPRHAYTNDHSLAVHALIEGDAIMLQNIWAQQNLTQDDLLQLARSAAGSDDSLARAPLIVRAELLFPYTDGFNYVRAAYREAGGAYGAIDDLFKNPPLSTAQVLHPDKYRQHVLPIDVQLADAAAILGPDWRPLGNGVLGELDTRVLLEQWGSAIGEANHIAAAWSGDRWQIIEKDGHPAIAYRSSWESAEAASNFFTAYTRGLLTRFADCEIDEASATRQALTTSAAATDVRLQDSSVLVVIAFDRESADSIVNSVTVSDL